MTVMFFKKSFEGDAAFYQASFESTWPFFFLLVVVLYRMYYISVTDVVGGNVMTEVQETTNLAILLCKCYCGTITACLLDFEHPVCYYCKTLFLIQKKLPTVHFKEIENH